MARRNRKWSYSEEKLLMRLYGTHTIKELLEVFPRRDADSINCKIKRLKAKRKIKEGKTDDTVKRSYLQRGKDTAD
jgi:hypothetical protein